MPALNEAAVLQTKAELFETATTMLHIRFGQALGCTPYHSVRAKNCVISHVHTGRVRSTVSSAYA